ncbi:MAG: efflux RND transporter periplasmic adaptor subunit [Candidatus Eremiobacteraeota bacterium]|nr:efflux RND transporter periplasmic adaptor subunit [Candidatus Eremiobacteraeota bacterium]
MLWIGLAAGLVAIFIVVLLLRRHTTIAQPDAQPLVALATARIGTFVETVTATGRVGAPAGSQTKAVFAVPGIIAAIDVKVGDRVSRGQPLAQLDTRALSLAAAQAQADARAAAAAYSAGGVSSAAVASAQAKLESARVKVQVDQRELDRTRNLYVAGISAKKDIETSRAQVSADEALVSAAQADVRIARSQGNVQSAQVSSAQYHAAALQNEYANGTLFAPVGGVVTAIYKHSGENVDMSTPVLAIGPEAQAEVTLAVPAADAARIHVGDLADVRVPGSDSSRSARVSAVVPAVDPTTQSATVVLSGVPAGAYSGDAVQATIMVGQDRGVLVPQSAIVQDPQSGKTLVFVKTADTHGVARFSQTAVQVAHNDGRTAEIATGLRAGERVAAQGSFALLAPSGSGD